MLLTRSSSKPSAAASSTLENSPQQGIPVRPDHRFCTVGFPQRGTRCLGRGAGGFWHDTGVRHPCLISTEPRPRQIPRGICACSRPLLRLATAAQPRVEGLGQDTRLTRSRALTRARRSTNAITSLNQSAQRRSASSAAGAGGRGSPPPQRASSRRCAAARARRPGARSRSGRSVVRSFVQPVVAFVRSFVRCGAALALFIARSALPPRARRRDARPPLLRGGGSCSRRCVTWSAACAQQLALSACGSGRGRRRAALTAPPLRRRAGAPSADSVMPPRSRRRDARPPLLPAAARSLSARGASCSTARALCVRHCRRSPSRRSCGAAACGAALALFVARSASPPRARRRDARPPLLRGGGSCSQRCGTWSAARSLRVAVSAVASSLGAVAVAPLLRRRRLRRRAGALRRPLDRAAALAAA